MKVAPLILLDVSTAIRQFECVERGFCPDCGSALPARQRSAGAVQCTNCGELWSIEHKPEPPK